ncbi:MAG TPA: RluA family pseudouridine synthase [Fimbriiglobus sp.]|jgi:23S rRNA pseudouridine1911/1915/1917 synthase
MSSLADVLDVLYEDNHLLGLNKPAGWPTTHFDGKEETVDRLAKTYLKEKHHKPGNVFIGVVHRLDKPVSGALLFAKTSKAAARLSEQFREGAVEKIYWAVVEEKKSTAKPFVWDETGSLDDWLLHKDAEHRVDVVTAETPGAKPARLFYTVKARHAGKVWLELKPHTGRKHQLRVQLAHRGWPVYGDRKYGSLRTLGHAIALHARQLTVLHPVKKDPLTITAEVPQHWKGRFAYLLHETPL